VRSFRLGLLAIFRGLFQRLDSLIGADSLQSLGDDPISRLEAGEHQPHLPLLAARLDRRPNRDVVASNDVDEFHALIDADCLFRNRNRLIGALRRNPDPNKKTAGKRKILVFEDAPDADRARPGIELIGSEIELALMVVIIFVCKLERQGTSCARKLPGVFSRSFLPRMYLRSDFSSTSK